jgi:multimeric flavodoxin WrbA
MKALVVNASPSMDKGNTALILGPFVEGMKEAGADVEIFYTRKLNIEPCQGDYACWVKTPGECIYNDDMKDVIPKVHDSEILVFACPVYVDGVPGPLKMFMDRLIPYGLPFIEIREDHCRHPERGECTGNGRFALVSSCGFWELDNFDAMVVHMKAFCKNMKRPFAGALLRPHAGAVRPMMEMGFAVQEIFDAAREAGRQIVKDGVISEETMKVVSKDLLPREFYVDKANESFREALAKVGHG